MSGYVNLVRKKWEERQEDLEKVVAVVRGRVEHNETKVQTANTLLKNIILVMNFEEYNNYYTNLKDYSSYYLNYSNIILAYTFQQQVYKTSSELPTINEVPHGNAKCMTAKIFRPLAHSVKIETREKISQDKRVPRLI